MFPYQTLQDQTQMFKLGFLEEPNTVKTQHIFLSIKLDVILEKSHVLISEKHLFPGWLL